MGLDALNITVVLIEMSVLRMNCLSLFSVLWFQTLPMHVCGQVKADI
jgi:hypothetical protein